MAKIVKPRPEEPHPYPSHWDDIRAKVLERDGNKCRLCGDDQELHVHHLTYENWGNEGLDDLTTLCKEHHKFFHKQNKKLKKRTPECPECKDIHDVVGPDTDGDYKCNYHKCSLYFNGSGEIIHREIEDEKIEVEEEYHYESNMYDSLSEVERSYFKTQKDRHKKTSDFLNPFERELFLNGFAKEQFLAFSRVRGNEIQRNCPSPECYSNVLLTWRHYSPVLLTSHQSFYCESCSLMFEEIDG